MGVPSKVPSTLCLPALLVFSTWWTDLLVAPVPPLAHSSKNSSFVTVFLVGSTGLGTQKTTVYILHLLNERITRWIKAVTTPSFSPSHCKTILHFIPAFLNPRYI